MGHVSQSPMALGRDSKARKAFFIVADNSSLLFYFLGDVGTKEVWSLVHFSSFPFFLAPPKKEAKKLSGSTYVLGVRSRSYVSLAVVS